MNQLRKTRHGQPTSINAKVARRINRAIVLNLIRERQPVSRSAISTASGLNKSTVSNIVAGLLNEELVSEEQSTNHEIGRTPFHLRIRSGKHFVGAVYFDSSVTQLAVVDINGVVRNRIELDTEKGNPSEFVARCIGDLENLRKRIRLLTFRGIGITVAGIVDPLLSKVVFAPNLGWDNFDIGATVKNVVPGVESINVENDARASVLAELLLGNRRPKSGNVVFLSVGYGIGAGIMIDNHLLNGTSHAAGEFGHMTVVEGGERCSCGNRGCWEVYASDRATIRRLSSTMKDFGAGPSTLSMTDVIRLANAGDQAACQELRTTGQYLGRGLSNIIRSFDPEVIFIGGLITRAWDLIYPEIMEEVSARAFSGKEQYRTIVPTSLTDSPPLLGAAALSIRRIFSDQRTMSS